MNKDNSKTELMGIGVFGLLVGLSLILAGFWAARQLHIVWNSWPSTDGMVVRGTVQEIVEVPYTRGGMPFHTYTPRIEFRYTVGSKAYSTEAPAANTTTTFDQAAVVLSKLYATGTHHPIHYNPQNPQDIEFGTIKLGPLVLALFLLVLGGVLSAVGVKSLIAGTAHDTSQTPSREAGTSAKTLPFVARTKPEPLALTMICPSCGRRVMATEDNCPNCLKALRAA